MGYNGDEGIKGLRYLQVIRSNAEMVVRGSESNVRESLLRKDCARGSATMTLSEVGRVMRRYVTVGFTAIAYLSSITWKEYSVRRQCPRCCSPYHR